MDLVGDFAGDEPFVIDGTFLDLDILALYSAYCHSAGDSLLQHVLDDEMLAIGGEGEVAGTPAFLSTDLANIVV